MAEQRKRRVVKRSQTVREKRVIANRTADEQPRKRYVRQAAGRVSRPVGKAGGFLAVKARPLGFLTKPFRSRPARFAGRNLYKFLGIRYLVNSWKELLLVQWPSRGETTRLTIAVFVFAILIAGFIAVLDFGLDKVFRQLLT